MPSLSKDVNWLHYGRIGGELSNMIACTVNVGTNCHSDWADDADPQISALLPKLLQKQRDLGGAHLGVRSKYQWLSGGMSSVAYGFDVFAAVGSMRGLAWRTDEMKG